MNAVREGGVAVGNRWRRGFTLIELMVAVAVVAILAAIAIPAYDSYIRRSRRADARIALMEAAQNMERYFTANATYAGATSGTVYSATSPGGFYALAFQNTVTQNAYVLEATPVAGTSQARDTTTCAQFTINARGVKTSSPATDCWDR